VLASTARAGYTKMYKQRMNEHRGVVGKVQIIGGLSHHWQVDAVCNSSDVCLNSYDRGALLPT